MNAISRMREHCLQKVLSRQSTIRLHSGLSLLQPLQPNVYMCERGWGGGKQKTNFHPVWIKKVYGILGHTKLECLVKDMDNEDIYLYGVANAILDRWDSSAERFLFFLQLIY